MNRFSKIERVYVYNDKYGNRLYDVHYKSHLRRVFRSLSVPKIILNFIRCGNYSKYKDDHHVRYVNKE